jgi:dephospho-CoA kinase
MVRRDEKAFLARARRAGHRVAVLDIPLLFETGGRKVDRVVVVSAPRTVQMHRVRLRRKMSAADIEAVLARQMPDAEKRRRADLVVRTGLSRFHALRTLRRLIEELRA